MASFGQWRQSNGGHPASKRVTWICGSEPVLVEHVLDYLRADIGAKTEDSASFAIGQDPEAKIWAEANQFPLTDGAKRLVVIRHAQRIQDWAPLLSWLEVAGRVLPATHLILVSDDADLDYAQAAKASPKERPLKPHLAAVQAKGALVVCNLPKLSTAAGVVALAWVHSMVTIHDDVAKHLITRTGGDLGAINNVCAKLRLFKSPPSTAIIDALVEERPGELFVDALVLLDKALALDALSSIRETEYAWTIGDLDELLTALEEIAILSRRGVGIGVIAEAGPGYRRINDKFGAVAANYDAGRVTRTRRVLAEADQLVRQGARVGVMEALVLQW